MFRLFLSITKFWENQNEMCVRPMILSLKFVGCWDWYPSPQTEKQVFINYTYLCLILFILLNIPVMMLVHIYSEWVSIMWCIERLSDSLPFLATLFTVSYFALYRKEVYDFQNYMDKNFKYHSAKGLSNMNMDKSCKAANMFACLYTACALTSSTMYIAVPMYLHYIKGSPLHGFAFMDISCSPYIEITFLSQLIAQTIMGLTLGQLGVFFASNSILLCGQLDILCCSLRNARFSALLKNGVQYRTLTITYGDALIEDEKHNYIYNESVLLNTDYHYDRKSYKILGDIKTYYDIHGSEFDNSTVQMLKECAYLGQVIKRFKDRFESFVSPLLICRVVQVTLYLCFLLYSASQKLNIVTVEYLLATAFDIFIYCFYGNQITVQADRVTTAAYQSYWQTMGVRPRRILLNLMLSHKHKLVVRAGSFLHMNMSTYVLIIKSSFSYYTLLSSVNEHK